MLLGARMLLGAPGLTTRNKDATRSFFAMQENITSSHHLDNLPLPCNLLSRLDLQLLIEVVSSLCIFV